VEEMIEFNKDNSDRMIGFCTVPNKEVGEKIANILVNSNLVACVNIITGLTSIYRWKGQIYNDPECLCIFKTITSRIAAIQDTIKINHHYEVSEIIFIEIKAGLPAYLQWIAEQTQN
jgi:periplasmic divalent cation tolerance protein